MNSRSSFCRTAGVLILGMALLGCGQKPLISLKTIAGCPWSAPHKQMQIGMRSQGQSFYGALYKNFWKADSGEEYDPEKVSQQVWAYLTKTGDVARITEEHKKGVCSSQMRIVSVDPVIVLIQPCQHKHFNGEGPHGTRVVQELAYTSDRDMYFDEPMQWVSPDLSTGPNAIRFSPEGIATIPLENGQIKLVHEGEWCKVTRE